MTAAVKPDPFAKLLVSDAKGFFFLKLLLADHTNDQKLAAIINRTYAIYNRIVAEKGTSNFLPLFRFRRAGEKIELVIFQESGSSTEQGCLALATVMDPVGKEMILALETKLPIPAQQLRDLSLEALKTHLELYYELVDICTANTISRMVKSFEEIQQACAAATWTYDLSSGEDKKIGLRVRKSGKSWLALFVDIHL